MHIFTSLDFSGEEIICNEGDLAWVPIAEVPNLPSWEGDRIFLHLLAKESDFFNLSLYYKGDKLEKAILDDISIPLPFEQ